MKKCCFTIVSDDYYYKVGTHIFVNTFRKFHPDIPLIIFRQDTIDKVFAEKGINFYNAKPTFAKLLTDKYDLIANIDADTVICGRLTEVFDNVDYETGCAWNFNDYENASFENITPEMYLQAGMVASTSVDFWNEWELANKRASYYIRQENDILNKVVYGEGTEPKYKLKIFDKDKDYYGCKSLGRESEFYMEGKQVMCRKEKVLAYHHAKGASFPKLNFAIMGFQPEVRDYLKYISEYGQSSTIGGV